MMTFDPMTSDLRAEMDAFHSARNPAAASRTIDAPAWMYEDSTAVKAVKVAGLLKAREDLASEMIERGVTSDRIAALARYNEQLIALGWTPNA
jgi:TolB-like protein